MLTQTQTPTRRKEATSRTMAYPYVPIPKPQEEQRPAQAPGLVDGLKGPVWVPLLQSAVTGLLAAVFFLAITSTFQIDRPTWLPWPSWLRVNRAWFFVLIWISVTFWAWQLLFPRWQELVEVILKRDLNQDGTIGPAPARRPLKVIVMEPATPDHGPIQRYPYLEGDDIQLRMMARALLNDDIFSERQWVKAGRFNEKDYKTNLQAMREHNILRERVPGSIRHGYQLTPVGRAVMRDLATVDSEGGEELDEE
jgi:hypothetical protein